MGTEIERKFLVYNCIGQSALQNGVDISQGYVKTNGITMRIRITEYEGKKEAVLTIKKKLKGFSRLEYEYPIPLEDANDMLDKLCRGKVIRKTRYKYQYYDHVWEIDCFKDKYSGLIIAEIELKSEEEEFKKPVWIGEEVTYNKLYTNEMMYRRL